MRLPLFFGSLSAIFLFVEANGCLRKILHDFEQNVTILLSKCA